MLATWRTSNARRSTPSYGGNAASSFPPAAFLNRCDRFLTHLEALHLARVPQLRSALGEGYPLHIDATCEHVKGGLLVCMDGWRGWVLGAGRIPSEHEEHLRPLVAKTTRLFGDPIATVRDMGQGVAPMRLPPCARRASSI